MGGMRLVLIGHGYLGTAVAGVFRGQGWEVEAASLAGGEGVRACDVADRSAVATLPDADAVVHCAASGRGGEEAYRSVYLEGCRHLVARYPGVPLVFTSSTSVYAQVDGSLVDEGSVAEPDRATGRILREAEEVVLGAGGVVARLAGIYGPGRSVLLRRFLAGESRITEEGGRFLNQIHRDDAASAVLALALLSGARGEIYNVSDDRPLREIECYRALSEMFSLPLPPSGPREVDRKRGWTDKRVSNARLRACGWEPRFPCFLDAAREIAATL
jgi:nucleoside-diphosphate-sugar epimerase